MLPLPTRVQNLEAEAAFTVMARAQALQAQGKDVINLGIGQPDFHPPQHVSEAANQALADGHHGYTAAPGTIECRQAVSTYIAQHYGVDVAPSRVLITPGGKMTLSFACLLLGDPGAEFLVPDPGFPTYGVMSQFAGAKLVTYGLDSQNGFSFTADEIAEKMNEHTRLIILNSPGNPTGGINDPAEIAKLLVTLKRYPNAYVLSDEIYSRLSFDGAFESLLTQEGLKDRLIVLDGWSKTYAMTGWRLGWSVWPENLVEGVTNLAIHMHGCVNAVAQVAGAAALLGDQSQVEAMRAQYIQRRDLVFSRLNDIPGVECRKPGGAFYCFPDVSGLGVTGAQAQTELLEQYGVATIAGTSFGPRSVHNLRLSFATSDQNLTSAIDRIAQWAASK